MWGYTTFCSWAICSLYIGATSITCASWAWFPHPYHKTISLLHTPAYGVIIIPVLLVRSHITKYLLRERSMYVLWPLWSKLLVLKGYIVILLNWRCMSILGVIRRTLFVVFWPGSQSPVLWTIWAEVIWKHWMWMAIVLDVLYSGWGIQWQYRTGNTLEKKLLSRIFLLYFLSVNGCADPVSKWKSSPIGEDRVLF